MKNVILIPIILVSIFIFSCSENEKEQTITVDTTKKTVQDLVSVPEKIKNPDFLKGKQYFEKNDFRTALNYFQKVPMGDDDYVSVITYINICKDKLDLLPPKVYIDTLAKKTKSIDTNKVKSETSK